MEKKKLDLVKSTTNANLMYDNYEDKHELQEIMRRYYSEDFNKSKIGYVINRVSYGSALSLVHYTDMHAMHRDATRGDLMDEYIAHTITNVVDSGDQKENAVEGYHMGGMSEASLNGEQEDKLLQSFLDKIGNKIVAACGGNHNDPELASRLKSTYANTTKLIYENKDIPYYSRGVIVIDLVPVKDGKKIKGYAPHVTVLLHCGNGTPTKQLDAAEKNFILGMDVMAKFNREHKTNLVPDLILGGDYHSNTNLDKKVVREIRNNAGRVVGTYTKTIRVRNGASQKRQSASAFDNSFPATHIANATQYHITCSYNKDYDKNGFNNAPEYLFNYTEFEILKRKSNDLSTIAKQYQLARYDMDVKQKAQRIVKKMDNKQMAQAVLETLEAN